MGRMFVWERKYLSLCTVLGNGGIAWHLSQVYLQVSNQIKMYSSKHGPLFSQQSPFNLTWNTETSWTPEA